jgi:hypothetical protein
MEVERYYARRRATKSVEPPGAEGTMMVTGRFG